MSPNTLNGECKSLKLNMLLNAIKGLMSVIFPLVTFPYVSRILGVDNLGRYNFANSVISYFILIAGLGVSTYAIREGGSFRDERSIFKRFADEMFTINMFATIIAYILLVLFMLIIPKFANYSTLLVILSLQIVFKTIGIEWVYSIYENYAYITVRSILFQLISLMLLFLFVKTQKDVNAYAAITVVSSVGSNIMNYLHARKYCKVEITRYVNWKKHIKPIIILFAMSVTTTIYVSSDITILGFLCSDYNVGIYSVSAKIYSIVKTLLSSLLVVSIPRISALLGKKDMEMFSLMSADIYKSLITVMLPTMVGMMVLSNEIVAIVSGEDYKDAIPSLVILNIALIFCMAAWFWGQCILVPLKKENVVFKATVISALVNIGLNFAFIPYWKENAAAFSTLIAEAIVFFLCWKEGRKFVEIKGIFKMVSKVILGCVSIFSVTSLLNILDINRISYVLASIIISASVYFVVEVCVKNETVIWFTNGIITRIKRKEKLYKYFNK